jgi:hypothetical protein
MAVKTMAPVMKALKNCVKFEVIRTENVILATARVLDSENRAWEVAQNWLQLQSTAA